MEPDNGRSPTGPGYSPEVEPQASPAEPSIPNAWAVLSEAMRDPDYAWGWHCNLAVPIMDAAGVSHERANVAAAHLMQHIWDCDITQHPLYRYGKSSAQSYAEFRIALDEAEDASAIEAATAGETAKHGSTEGESAGPQDDAHPLSPSTPSPKEDK